MRFRSLMVWALLGVLLAVGVVSQSAIGPQKFKLAPERTVSDPAVPSSPQMLQARLAQDSRTWAQGPAEDPFSAAPAVPASDPKPTQVSHADSEFSKPPTVPSPPPEQSPKFAASAVQGVSSGQHPAGQEQEAVAEPGNSPVQVLQLRARIGQQAPEDASGSQEVSPSSAEQSPTSAPRTSPRADSSAPQRQAQPDSASGADSGKVETKAVIGPVGEGDSLLEIYVYDRDIREVLAMLSRQGGWNILPMPSVRGKVSLSLSRVDLETALAALLRATGYVARREGNVIYVGAPEDFSKSNQAVDVIGTRVYRPSYITAKELEELLTPLLSPQVGKIKSSTAAGRGIQADANSAGGNDLAGGDVLVVQDYESILRRMDQIVREVDRRPPQVAIEAMILSVELDDEFQYGVDFELLRNKAHLRLVISDPAASLNQIETGDGMLSIAFLDSSIGAFLEALETIGDTNVIATPRLLVLNKQRAEILIGAQLGYVNTTVTETSATQSVDFLEVGTQLRIRPYIAHDRMIRLEIHPELSTGNVRVEQGMTIPDKEVTSVTTNILVQDGRTVIIGGLLREELVTNRSQVPLLGNLPIVGALFREETEQTRRREILVLVTPRIVDQEFLDREGDSLAAEFHRRQQIYADKMSPLGKRYLGRKYFRLAQEAWAQGDRERAMRFINLSIHFDPLNRAAIQLRSDIANGRSSGPHTLDRLLRGAAPPQPPVPPADDSPAVPELVPSPQARHP